VPTVGELGEPMIRRLDRAPPSRLSSALGSASGEFLELLERLGIEERPACRLAGATRLGADGAMTVMLGVTRALIGAERALPDAGVQQPVNDDVV
jgi:hypothetical protein